MRPTKTLFQRKLVKAFKQMGWERTRKPRFLPRRIRLRQFYISRGRYVIALDGIAERFLRRRKGYVSLRIHGACYGVEAKSLPHDLNARAIALAYLATRRPTRSR